MIAVCHDCSEYETYPWFWGTVQYSGWNTSHVVVECNPSLSIVKDLN